MKLHELLETTPENLAMRQRDALIDHAVSILDTIRERIRSGCFDLDDMLFHSPAGDGYGENNDCINFNFTGVPGAVMDIRELVGRLRSLDDICAPEQRLAQCRDREAGRKGKK